MSAAERLRPTKRQRRREALLMAVTAFANQLADIMDEYDLSEPDEGEANGRARRAAVRVPYVPTHGQVPSNEAFAKAEAAARRRGLR